MIESDDIGDYMKTVKTTSGSKEETRRKLNSSVKKSVVVSGLVGTAGFFIAKAIGLIYAIPFASILGSDALMNYYGTAYRIYSYILNIFTAGFPFAIATMVSAYIAKGNNRVAVQVKRLALLFMTLIGFLGMIIMMALSAVFARIVTDVDEGIHIMTVVLCLLALAVFFVPILSAVRGFIQGCKEMEEYAFSQAFEQVFRVAFLLSFACLFVYVFKMARVWALYAAVMSTSVAAVAAIVQIHKSSVQCEKTLLKEAKGQKTKSMPIKPLAKEFILLAVPYMLSAILGYSDDIFNTLLLPTGLRLSKLSAAEIDTVMSAVNYAGTKLMSIPMILAPGFTAAIVPHLSEALARNDQKTIRKDIVECINIVLFMGGLISFLIALYARPIYYSLFRTDDLALAANSVQWLCIEGFLGTIAPVLASLMMALHRFKSLIRRLLVQTLIKGVLIVPLTMLFGFPGAVIATMISYGYLITFNYLELKHSYKVKSRSSAGVIVATLIGLIAVWIVATVLGRFGLGRVDHGRVYCFITMCVNGLVSLIVFVVIEWFMGVPQKLFHLGRKSA